jgi:hypothetical protein
MPRFQRISGHDSKKSLEVYQHLPLEGAEQAYQPTVRAVGILVFVCVVLVILKQSKLVNLANIVRIRHIAGAFPHSDAVRKENWSTSIKHWSSPCGRNSEHDSACCDIKVTVNIIIPPNTLGEAQPCCHCLHSAACYVLYGVIPTSKPAIRRDKYVIHANVEDSKDSWNGGKGPNTRWPNSQVKA